MYKDILYHGANKNRCHEMLDIQKMLFSRGEHHWLGDGGYLFTEDFYAYKWIRDMYKNCNNKYPNNEKELSAAYCIMKVFIHVKRERIFDLTKAQHKILYDAVYKELSKSGKISGIAEGVVINYIFNELPGYKEEYDLVRALFTLNRHKYKPIHSNTRLDFMPQEQICIKNNDVVENIKRYDFSGKFDMFNELLKNYYFEDTNPKKKSYSNKRRYGYSRKVKS